MSAIGSMVDALKRIVTEVKDASGNLSVGSQQISSTSQALAHGATVLVEPLTSTNSRGRGA